VSPGDAAPENRDSAKAELRVRADRVRIHEPRGQARSTDVSDWAFADLRTALIRPGTENVVGTLYECSSGIRSSKFPLESEDTLGPSDQILRFVGTLSSRMRKNENLPSTGPVV
jgi:hypothetical protein